MQKQKHFTSGLKSLWSYKNFMVNVCITSSRISRFLCRSSGRSRISCSMLCRPPCWITARLFSRMDWGTASPDRSSSAAGRFKDANTLTIQQQPIKSPLKPLIIHCLNVYKNDSCDKHLYVIMCIISLVNSALKYRGVRVGDVNSSWVKRWQRCGKTTFKISALKCGFTVDFSMGI